MQFTLAAGAGLVIDIDADLDPTGRLIEGWATNGPSPRWSPNTPMHEPLLTLLRARSKLLADETTMPVLDPRRARTKTRQLWACAADDRPWGGLDPPGIAYVCASNRKAYRLFSHLLGFKGVLQVDGYNAYAELAERGEVELAFCLAAVDAFEVWLRATLALIKPR